MTLGALVTAALAPGRALAPRAPVPLATSMATAGASRLADDGPGEVLLDMEARVLFARHQAQVLDPVVRNVPIHMVDMLGRKQLAPDVLLHDDPCPWLVSPVVVDVDASVDALLPASAGSRDGVPEGLGGMDLGDDFGPARGVARPVILDGCHAALSHGGRTVHVAETRG